MTDVSGTIYEDASLHVKCGSDDPWIHIPKISGETTGVTDLCNWSCFIIVVSSIQAYCKWLVTFLLSNCPINNSTLQCVKLSCIYFRDCLKYMTTVKYDVRWTPSEKPLFERNTSLSSNQCVWIDFTDGLFVRLRKTSETFFSNFFLTIATRRSIGKPWSRRNSFKYTWIEVWNFELYSFC